MPGIFDYLEWRGDLSMKDVPLCDADKLILSELCYIDLGAKEPTPLPQLCVEALRRQNIIVDSGSTHSLLHHKEDEKLMLELAKSPRFSELKIGYCESHFSKKREEQFAAMTVFLPYGTAVIVYRGTDWTLVGWKEDFNLAFEEVLPAQKRAVEYLNRIGSVHEGDICVTGHSKGGNLAVFASAFCLPEISERIIEVTSLDGPGFTESVLNSPEFAKIESRVNTFMPKASIVGAILSRVGKFTVIESKSFGVAQHIPYNWEIMRGGFVSTEVRDGTSQLAQTTLNEWIASLTREERKRFIDTVWSIFSDVGAEEISELLSGKKRRAIIKNYNSLDEESRTYIKSVLAKLTDTAKQSVRDLIVDSKKATEKNDV